MLYNTIIKEGEITPNKRIYTYGSLAKIKEKLQPYIDKNICFVALGADRDCFLKYNGYSVEDLSTDRALGLYSGIVKSFDIKNNQGELEIQPIPTSSGRNLQALQECGVKFNVDFDVACYIEDGEYPRLTVNDVSPVVILRRANG